jgi:hypothetical protein
MFRNFLFGILALQLTKNEDYSGVCYNERMPQRTVFKKNQDNQDVTTNTDATTNAEEYYRPTQHARAHE